MSASDSAKSRMERILRLHEQIDALKLDIRQVYAEEKADGGDKTAMGAAISYIRKREKDSTALAEREAMADVYVAAYDAVGTRIATHTHAPDSYSEAKGRGDAVGNTDAKLIATVATGMQTEIGRKALVTALDIMIEREQAEQNEPEAAAEVAGDYLREPVAAEQGQIIREGDAPRETGRLGGDASCLDANSEIGNRAQTHNSHHVGRASGAERQGAVAAQVPDTHSAASSSRQPDTAGAVTPPAVPAPLSDDDIPAFIKQDKPDCLKLKDGHCRLSFATSALCAECNQRRAMARALA